MATKGKRVIFAGPADDANHKPLKVEGLAVKAITPGTLVKQTASGLDIDDNADTVFGVRFLVANIDENRSLSTDDDWTINESMEAIAPRPGEFVNALVAAGQNITSRGTALARNGAGDLKIAATGGTDAIVAYSDEIVDTTGGAQLVRVTPSYE